MMQFKEFQGKTLDAAIGEACDYFGVAREKLEIEILSDAKTGIFGLVGAKKATIRAARRMADASIVLDEIDAPDKTDKMGKADDRLPTEKTRKSRDTAGITGKTVARPTVAASAAPAPSAAGEEKAPGANASRKGRAEPKNSPQRVGKDVQEEGDGGGKAKTTGRDERSRKPLRGVGKRTGNERDGAATAGKESAPPSRPQQAKKNAGTSFTARRGAPEAGMRQANDERDERDDLLEFDIASRDPESLKATVSGIVLRLVKPVVGEVPCEVILGKDRIRVRLDCGDASGLLVGREGQTLASVQYLASRILARELGGSVRLHVDAGHYREQQNDKLKELALSLAARAKKSGRTQTTRPLSAYQRRIVHLALEEDPEVTTQSKGEGAQRRVAIYLAGERTGQALGRKKRDRREESRVGNVAEQDTLSGESFTNGERRMAPDVLSHTGEEAAQGDFPQAPADDAPEK